MLSKRESYRFIAGYKPTQYEKISEKDTRYNLKKRYVNLVLTSRDRFYVSLKYALKHFPGHTLKILDLGPYPGTLLRILKGFFNEYDFNLYGAGLHLTPDFIKIMEDIGAIIMPVNLDPSNEQLKSKNYSSKIPLEDGTTDFIFGLEIIEHLSSPIHMLSEASRVLRKGGKLLLTTPNISRIGSVFKLLLGMSNLEGIIPIEYWNENDEWRPHFREYSMGELEGLLTRLGFTVIDKVFFNSNLTHFNVKTIKQRLVDVAKAPFYCVPHLREHLLIVGKKV